MNASDKASTSPSNSNGSGWSFKNLSHILRSLRHRNYRLFFGGQAISLIGTWMQSVAQGWLVYQLTGDPNMLGVVGFSSQILSLVLFPFAGVMADRWNRHRLVVVTQSVAAIQAFALAALTYAGVIHVWHVIALSALMGVVMAFDIPIRQSFVVEMLDRKEDLPNAIALNSLLFNSARIVGPSVAGFLIALWGTGTCFLLNGVSYLFVIAALLSMKLIPRKIKPDKRPIWESFHEGFRYVFTNPALRGPVLMLALVGLMGMPYAVLMPVFAKDVLHGNSATLGFLVSATGAGALMGAAFLASRKSVLGLEKLMAVGPMLFGAGLIAFASSTVLGASLPLLVLVGFSMMVLMASTNTFLQTIVDDDKRGRVMSFYSMAFMGMGPFGSLLVGWLAKHFSAGVSLYVGAAACILGAMIFAARLPILTRSAHPAYIRLGILPGGDLTPGATLPNETSNGKE
jgi:MFS family permease